MKSFAAATTLGAASATKPIAMKFMNHLVKFGKIIDSVEEFNTRLAYFSTLDQFIDEHNAGEHSF